MNDNVQKRPFLETEDADDAIDLDYEQIKDDILIFSSEDERLKFLGEILSLSLIHISEPTRPY